MKKNAVNQPDIDIVLPWVDGSDPIWQASKRDYSGQTEDDDRDIRYRDWGLLKYVFRGIEQNLPWVRKVHFITCGHLPDWLNTDCPQLHIVKHSDYIPEQWLPTFSANPIELNIHRIEGLSEQFIYINDDTFFVKPMEQGDFFRNGKPLSQAGLDVIGEHGSVFAGILYADRELINRNFFSRKVFFKHISKFINIHYRAKDNVKSLMLSMWCYGFFPGFPLYHGPNAFLKSTFKEVWEKESKQLSETSARRFRSSFDVNQYVFLWWQWCSGNFIPAPVRERCMYLGVDKNKDYLSACIRNPRCPMLCVNDFEIPDYEEKREAINNAFEAILGEKSQFER